MEKESSKLQIINYRTVIISSIIVVANIIFRWYQNQYPDIEENTPMYIYKIRDLIKVSDLLATTICIIAVIFAIVSFIGVGAFEVSAEINFKIVGIVILMSIIYFIFRSAYIMITIDKYMYSEDRIKVASMVVNGELGKGSKYDTFELPKEYKKVSRDHGKITVRREDGNTWVYFTAYRGLESDQRNTFVYCKEDSEKLLVDNSGYTYKEKKLKDHWFWAVIR